MTPDAGARARLYRPVATDAPDPQRYPRLAQYLAMLPDGLDSYPECRAKGSLIVSALEAHDTEGLGEGLPDAMVAMIRDPPSPGIWVAAPFSDAIFYAMCDAFYPEDEAVLRWTVERTLRTANSRLYRAISRVTRPGTLLKMAAATHRLFQRGTDLSAEHDNHSATLRLTHPPHLHGGLNHRSNVPMFEAMLSHCGATNIRVVMVKSSPTEAVYEAGWTP